ncbi:MAG TPA: hypothetical protein VFM97_00065 [Gammaproteobacteria bacterium]|nr:hypothetical protein [Gammaproteobacteria bacterium]
MANQNFTIDVDGVGTFVCRRRVMRDEFRIDAEYSRLTEGVEMPSRKLDATASMTATLKVQVVEAPEGWDLEKMDPLDPETYQRLLNVYTALMEREAFFRRGPGQPSQGSRQGNGGVDRTVVPEDVQTGADRSEVP